MKDLGHVTLSDIKTAAADILPNFLSSETSQTVIVCPPSTIAEVIEDFKEINLELTEFTNLENTFLYE